MGLQISYLNHIEEVAKADVAGLLKAEQSYGDSWKRRGGTGAFMMLARKWDRLENQVSKIGYDVFQAAARDTRAEGIIDDIRDLRRYLNLVESHLIAMGHVQTNSHRDNAPVGAVVTQATAALPETGGAVATRATYDAMQAASATHDPMDLPMAVGVEEVNVEQPSASYDDEPQGLSSSYYSAR